MRLQMQVAQQHEWDVSVEQARRIQYQLRDGLNLQDTFAMSDIRLVAGADSTYVREAGDIVAYAAVVVLDFLTFRVIETTTARRRVLFPYTPGLLAFREAPSILDACQKLTTQPDVFLFDAQGYAHFRRFGAASHIGLILNRPSIGCAKTRLVGEFQCLSQDFGSTSPLIDRGEVVGAAVRTQPNHPPLFVSPGHNISIDTAAKVVVACCRNHNYMPEPTRLAHHAVIAIDKPGMTAPLSREGTRNDKNTNHR